MIDSNEIKKGLEKAYLRLIEFKKYKKTPIIVSKDGQIVEIEPESIDTKNKVYK